MVVPQKHPKMIIFSKKNQWLLGTTISGNTHIGFPRFFLVAIICGAFFEEKVNLSLYMCMMCTVLQLIQRIALILPFKLKGNERKPSPSMNPKH